MEIRAKIYSTDTSVFVTIQKVASTLLSSLFDDSEHTGLGFDYSIDILNKRIIPAETNIGPIQLKVINDFDDIFSNKCNKNVVILYRNPKLRLISSIIEDFNNIIMNDTYSDFALSLLLKTFNASPSTSQFLKNNAGALYLSKIDKSDTELNNFLEEKNLLEELIKFTIWNRDEISDYPEYEELALTKLIKVKDELNGK